MSNQQKIQVHQNVIQMIQQAYTTFRNSTQTKTIQPQNLQVQTQNQTHHQIQQQHQQKQENDQQNDDQNHHSQYYDSQQIYQNNPFNNFNQESSPIDSQMERKIDLLVQAQNARPQSIPMQQAVKMMMDNDDILFVTGAGISVDSGISTFRGPNGLYSQNFVFQDKEYTPEQFLRKSFFDEHPQPIWDWIQQLNNMVKNSSPNENHRLIHECLKAMKKKGKNPVLVTQNIDDYHIKPSETQYQYHPVHGVASQIRCENLHYQEYCPTKIKTLCPQCQDPLRPHVMFFDQSYGHAFAKGVKNRMFDFVVVIGSSLSTGLCQRLVLTALQKIEINPNPVIQTGIVYPFARDAKEVLAQMLEQINKWEE